MRSHLSEANYTVYFPLPPESLASYIVTAVHWKLMCFHPLTYPHIYCSVDRKKTWLNWGHLLGIYMSHHTQIVPISKFATTYRKKWTKKNNHNLKYSCMHAFFIEMQYPHDGLHSLVCLHWAQIILRQIISFYFVVY